MRPGLVPHGLPAGLPAGVGGLSPGGVHAISPHAAAAAAEASIFGSRVVPPVPPLPNRGFPPGGAGGYTGLQAGLGVLPPGGHHAASPHAAAALAEASIFGSRSVMVAGAASGNRPVPLLPGVGPGGAAAARMSKCSNAQLLIEEMKAKERHVEEMKRQYEQLGKQIEGLAGKDSRWWPERTRLQNQRALIEQTIRLMDQERSQGRERSLPTRQLTQITPADAIVRLCNEFAEFLRSCPDRTCLMNKAIMQFKAQRTWTEMMQLGAIDKCMDVKQLLSQRRELFLVCEDDRNRCIVRLIGEPKTQDAPLAITTAPAGGGPVASILPGLTGQPLALACPESGEAQQPAGDPAGDLLRKLGERMAYSEMLRRLGEQLEKLSTSRASVCEAMAFCLEHAPKSATSLSKGLINSLDAPDISSETVVARLFLINDVLYNSSARVLGATLYRQTLQDLLPDAFEKLGRQSATRAPMQRAKVESGARKVFSAWRSWSIFPMLFIGGLEMLLCSPPPKAGATTPEASGDCGCGPGSAGPEESLTEQQQAAADTEAEAADKAEVDEVLRQKLLRWRSATEATIPNAARQRGLAGPSLPVAECVRRLCRYERFWHTSRPRLEEQPHDRGGGEAGALDGEPLSEGDASTVEAMEAELVGTAAFLQARRRATASLNTLGQGWGHGSGAVRLATGVDDIVKKVDLRSHAPDLLTIEVGSTDRELLEPPMRSRSPSPDRLPPPISLRSPSPERPPRDDSGERPKRRRVDPGHEDVGEHRPFPDHDAGDRADVGNAAPQFAD